MLLKEARALCDRAMAAAAAQGVRLCVVVVDEFGLLVQLDRMVGAAPLTVALAEAKAATALNFQRPTREMGGAIRLDIDVGVKLTAIPGGVPIMRGGRIYGAIGICSGDAEVDHRLADQVIEDASK